MEEEPEDPILQFFTYDHLPVALQEHSMPFAIMARQLCKRVRRNPERTVALRKLLEAKDAAVRAYLFKDAFPSDDRETTVRVVGG